MAFTSRHLLTLEGLSADQILYVVDTAVSFKEISERDIKKVPTLRGKTVVSLFYEASTRTRMSFEIAAKRLSADFVSLSAAVSSASKGETLLDTARNIAAMRPDCLILRHGAAGAAHFLAQRLDCPIINGGDYKLFEVFGEVRVPLLRDLPAVHELALEAAVRSADYSTIGNVMAWKGALDWAVTDWARLRGGVSRAIRAPNLNELFAGPTSAFTGGSDPCWAVNNPTEAQKDLCVAQGVPVALRDTLQDLSAWLGKVD